MTLDEIERSLKHLAAKEDLALLQTEMHKEISGLLKWVIVLHTPTWLGIIGILIAILHK